MLRERTRMGVANARSEGRVGSGKPKLTVQQQGEIAKMVWRGASGRHCRTDRERDSVPTAIYTAYPRLKAHPATEGHRVTPETLATVSSYRTEHINRYG